MEERKWLINHAEEYGSKSTELFKAEGGPSKLEKIKQMVEILYSIRPEVGKYCWDEMIFRGRNDVPRVPEEIIASQAEVQEEMTQKVTRELDQMFIQDDEGNEDVEYASIELVEVPDSDNNSIPAFKLIIKITGILPLIKNIINVKLNNE